LTLLFTLSLVRFCWTDSQSAAASTTPCVRRDFFCRALTPSLCISVQVESWARWDSSVIESWARWNSSVVESWARSVVESWARWDSSVVES